MGAPKIGSKNCLRRCNSCQLTRTTANTSHTIYIGGRRYYCGYFRIVKD
jgi:hypothetical protein